MYEVTHRQLRNESGEVLRRVAAGETILVANHGQPAAMIGPPSDDVIEDLVSRRLLRRALTSPEVLTSIKRRRSTKSTAEILADVRGSW